MMGPIAGAFMTILIYLVMLILFFLASYIFVKFFLAIIKECNEYSIIHHLYIFLGLIAIAICLTLIAYIVGGEEWLIHLRNMGVENL